ncbi:MAG: hypothetical protein PVI86_05110 [Phycisphaerae bacterium]|jgi:hypothetical protein
MKRRFFNGWIVAVLLGGAAAWAQQPLDVRTLIEQALNEPAPITLENTTLGAAIELLTEQTGVEIVMPREVMSLTPNGPDTPVRKVDIPHMTVRDGLTAIFSRLGMTFVVREDHVEIVPKTALYNLGRTPTWTELETLTTLGGIEPGTDAAALASLESKMQFQVDRSDAWAALAKAVRAVGAGPGDEVLTLACAELGWTWTLSDERIVVLSFDEEIRRRLRQPVSLRVSDRPLREVLQMLAKRVHVDIYTDPGVLASLPDHVQQGFSLTVYDKPGEEVLDAIAGYTGLGYLIEPDGVLFYDAEHANPSGEPSDRGAAADPYVAVIDIPLDDGTAFRWLVRQSELPDDLKARRGQDLQRAFEAVRRADAAAQP